MGYGGYFLNPCVEIKSRRCPILFFFLADIFITVTMVTSTISQARPATVATNGRNRLLTSRASPTLTLACQLGITHSYIRQCLCLLVTHINIKIVISPINSHINIITVTNFLNTHTNTTIVINSLNAHINTRVNEMKIIKCELCKTFI